MEGPFLFKNVLVYGDDDKYQSLSVLVKGDTIVKIVPASEELPLDEVQDAEVIDGTNKLLLPGFINAHTHSSSQWGRGLIRPLPLELWVEASHDAQIRNPTCSPHLVYLSALQNGLETLLSGGTGVLDDLFVRDIEDVAAAVRAYKELGIRVVLALMLGDMALQNMIPLVPTEVAKQAGDAAEFRESYSPPDPAVTAAMLQLWTEAAERFHDPEGGVSIAVGPVHQSSASDELIRGSAEIRKKYGLCGHIHLLETRPQVLLSRAQFPEGGCVQKLLDQGWLDLPGTSCAHCVWLDDKEQDILAQSGAAVVHNPVSNLRLGSGVAPVRQYLKKGIPVGIGCDGASSNDGQHVLAALKMASILSTMPTPEYRDWLSPADVCRASWRGGAAALGRGDCLGALRTGYQADLVLYDLTTLSMLPRTDPLGLLVLGHHSTGPGGVVDSVFVRGRRVVKGGVHQAVDVEKLREELLAAVPAFIDPQQALPTERSEREYRMAMGLEGLVAHASNPACVTGIPPFRVNYDADIP